MSRLQGLHCKVIHIARVTLQGYTLDYIARVTIAYYVCKLTLHCKGYVARVALQRLRCKGYIAYKGYVARIKLQWFNFGTN